MKRPVTLVLTVAALLATGSAFAKDQSRDSVSKGIAAAAARAHHGGNEPRGNEHRGNDHRGNDHRGPENRPGNHAPPSHARRDVRPDPRNAHRNDRWDHYRSDWNRHPNYWDNRRHDRADYARYRYHFGSYHAPRGYYQRVWRRGDHLPRGWYSNSYVVYDWRPYRLYSPPYGYHWVRVGNDVLLTALATGFVLDVIYDIWY
jgi:Ni/Co efflux regulator RcnB